MALEHVAKDAGVFVVGGAVADVEVFENGYLHVVDVVAVPEGFEDGVAEAEDDQVLDGVFFRTVKDEFRKVYYAKTTSMSSYLCPFALICIQPADDMCSGLKIHYYYLRGAKYEQIRVWRKRQGEQRVFLQSFSESTIQKELAQLKKFKVPSFHCIIQVYENSVINSDVSLVDMIQFQFHPIKVRYIKLNNKEAMVTVLVSNCKDTDHC